MMSSTVQSGTTLKHGAKNSKQVRVMFSLHTGQVDAFKEPSRCAFGKWHHLSARSLFHTLQTTDPKRTRL